VCRVGGGGAGNAPEGQIGLVVLGRRKGHFKGNKSYSWKKTFPGGGSVNWSGRKRGRWRIFNEEPSGGSGEVRKSKNKRALHPVNMKQGS